MSGRIIEKEQATAFDRWVSPPVDRSAAEAARAAPTGAAHLLTAKQLEALQQQVHDEAYARGHAEGLAAGRADAEAHARRLAALVAQLERPFDDLDKAVEQELAELVETLAVQLLRRELGMDAATLAALAHEAIAALPSATRAVTVKLHPDDARLVAAHLDGHERSALRVEPDVRLAPGDLVVAAERSEVDGRIDTRVRTLLEAAAARPRRPAEAAAEPASAACDGAAAPA